MDSDPLYYDPDPHLKVTNRPTDTHMNIKTTYLFNSAVYCKSLRFKHSNYIRPSRTHYKTSATITLQQCIRITY